MTRTSWKSKALLLESEVADLKRQLLAKENQVTSLIRTIRETDNIIFSIGQSADGTWPTIRPRFMQLHDQMTARKVAESNAIGRVIESRLHEVYAEESSALKQITKDPK